MKSRLILTLIFALSTVSGSGMSISGLRVARLLISSISASMWLQAKRQPCRSRQASGCLARALPGLAC